MCGAMSAAPAAPRNVRRVIMARPLALAGGNPEEERRRTAAEREQRGRRRVTDPGGDAVVAEEAAEPELPVRIRRPGGARVPDRSDQLVQIAEGRLRREIEPEQPAAGVLLAVPEAGPDDGVDGRVREAQR